MGFAPHRLRVMFVDDEEALIRLCTFFLESRGFRVDAFNNIASALKAADDDSRIYDEAILEYTMPGKTGLELAREFQSLIPEMPIILTSAVPDIAKLEQLKSPNIVAVIKKPFDMDILAAAINRVLQIASTPTNRSSACGLGAT